MIYPAKPIWHDEGKAGLSQTTNLGYDVVAPRFPSARRQKAYLAANATINNNAYQWPLFINDIGIDLALAGSTAQAQATRDFYPRNFVMPGFTIEGQALDQNDYGNLCEFVHMAQHDALNGGALIQFWLKAQGGSATANSNRGVAVNKTFYGNQKIRGRHKPLLCQGYIGSMPREHQKGSVSPTYTMTFVVAIMISGPYQEDQVQVARQATWVDLLQGTKDSNKDHTLVWNDWWIQNWAKQNSANIFNKG